MTSVPAANVQLRPGSRISALGALFVLSLRQQVRGRRLLILALLFLLPIGIAIFARQVENKPEQLEFVLLLNMIPHALAPLAALLYASGMIQDEIEDQTLTYLLVRPFSKRSLYLVKLLAAFLTTVLLTAFFTTITCVVIYWGAADLGDTIFPFRAAKIAALFALGLLAYTSIFACLSLVAKRSLVLGIAYIIVFEGLLSGFDFATRRLTVVYYFRLLAARWLELPERIINEWSLHLDDAPTAQQCVLILLGASLAAAILGTQIFANREFRLKTPEGN